MKRLLSVLFPVKCPGCGLILSGGAFCEACEKTLLPCPGMMRAGGVRFYAPFYYSGCVRRALLLLKRSAPEQLTDYFAGKMAALIRDNQKRLPELVVCVPMISKRRRLRGYNQSQRLARRVAEILGVPFCRRALRQIRPTDTQHLLDHAARRDNVRNAFGARARDVSGKRLLLVDDIITTGATAAECLRALRAAGAAGVTVVCAASAGYGKRRPENGGIPRNQS